MLEGTKQFNNPDGPKESKIKKYHNAEKRLSSALDTLTYSGLIYDGGCRGGVTNEATRFPLLCKFLETKRQEVFEAQKPRPGFFADTGSRIIKGKTLDQITRSELLNLAGLPDDFMLDPFPEIPAPEAVEALVKQRTSGLLSLRKGEQPTTKYFNALKNLPYPRIVCTAILQVCKSYELGFDKRDYEKAINYYKTQYDIISKILQNK